MKIQRGLQVSTTSKIEAASFTTGAVASTLAPHTNEAGDSPTFSVAPIPIYTLLKPHSRASKDIQRASNREVHLAIAKIMHKLHVLQMPASARVRDWYRAPPAQLPYQVLVDAALQALIVGCMDQELGAERLKLLDARWHEDQMLAQTLGSPMAYLR